MKTIRELYDEAADGAKKIVDLVEAMKVKKDSIGDALKITALSAVGSGIAQSILGAAEGLRREIHSAKESAWITLPCDHNRQHPMERADRSSVPVRLNRGSEFVVAVRSISTFCKVGVGEQESTAVFFSNGDVLFTSMPYDEVHDLITRDPVTRRTVF
jgi:hypothetical protein